MKRTLRTVLYCKGTENGADVSTFFVTVEAYETKQLTQVGY